MSRMLVLDGDFTSRTVLAAALGHAGFDVQAASSLAEARALLAGAPFEGLILELELPDGHGFDLLQELRDSGERSVHGMRVMVVTSMHQHAQLARSRSLGVTDYMTKPFSPRELVSRLRAATLAA